MSQARRPNVLTEDALQHLLRKSDRAGILALMAHLAILGLLFTGSRVLPTLPGAMCWIGYAVALVFLFCPLHEVIHETAFASRVLNRAVGYGLGLVLLLPPRYFRAFHLRHHRYTQEPDRDPELGSPKPNDLGQYLRHVSGLPYWFAQVRVLLRNASGEPDGFISRSQCGPVISEARQYLGIYASALAFSLLTGSTVLWWYWLLPVLVAQPALRLFLLAEHTGCPQTKDMFSNTRTTLTNPVMRRLCWNMNYHTEHHSYAGIPFHRLPAAHSLLSAHLRNVGKGYLRVNRDILKSQRGRGAH